MTVIWTDIIPILLLTKSPVGLQPSSYRAWLLECAYNSDNGHNQKEKPAKTATEVGMIEGFSLHRQKAWKLPSLRLGSGGEENKWKMWKTRFQVVCEREAGFSPFRILLICGIALKSTEPVKVLIQYSTFCHERFIWVKMSCWLYLK